MSAKRRVVDVRAAEGTSARRPRAKRAADPDGSRVASRGRRFPFEQVLGRLPNPDPTLWKFSGFRRIGLYSLILREYGVVAGWCLQWVNSVLATERVIKAAKGSTPEEQAIADAAAERARKAWARVRNQAIVLQKLLMGRFYGFSRAEKVWRFDNVIKEWIPDLYDVPWEAWNFDDAQDDYLITATNPLGIRVDSSRFLHFQWGSADTRYGYGDLSDVYLILDKIQRIEEVGLQAVEDWSRLVAIVHMPNGFNKPQREKAIAAIKEQYRWYVVVPTDSPRVIVDTPNGNVTANGGAGRQEFEVIRFYERWIQIRLLGAPQTQDKALGTGKVEETRSNLWESSTPLGSASLDQCLNAGWMDSYCEMNLADVAVELRPSFDSDTTEIEKGITGGAATEIRNACLDLAASRITSVACEETIVALGVPRVRAKAIVASTLKERDDLQKVEPTVTKPSAPPTSPDQGAPDNESSNAGKMAIYTDRGIVYLDKEADVKTRNRGFVKAKELEVSDEWISPKTVAA